MGPIMWRKDSIKKWFRFSIISEKNIAKNELQVFDLYVFQLEIKSPKIDGCAICYSKK